MFGLSLPEAKLSSGLVWVWCGIGSGIVWFGFNW